MVDSASVPHSRLSPARKGLVCLVLALVLMLSLGLGHWMTRSRLSPGPEPGESAIVDLVVPRGLNAPQIGQLLADAGLDLDRREFGWASRLLGQASHLQSGVYRLRPGISLFGLVRMMADGDGLHYRITFIEGWRFQDILAATQKAEGLVRVLPADPQQASAQLLDALAEDDQMGGIVQDLRRRHHPGPQIEGLLFPDSFSYQPGDTDLSLLIRSIRLQQRTLSQAWEARQQGLMADDPYELLILASMIEKETQRDPDRAQVSAVFQNRLRVKMPLQSDPTTIYGLGSRFDGNLRRKDLSDPSPFNTYRHRGLPPRPIANPGRAALKAASQPAQTQALYFVAMGNGRSYFSADLPTHNQAVNHFQRRQGPPPRPMGAEAKP